MRVETETGQGIGQPVRRKEDFRFLTGKGHDAADHKLPEMAHATMVRTPYAHARIRKIDKSAAQAAPGVIAVFTGADFIADGGKPMPPDASWMGATDVGLTIRAGLR